MSSQFVLGHLQSHDAHTHASTLDNSNENEDGVTVRPMRLKVLYTFDDQNKTNCLARWPHVLQIQTIMMEEGAMIGVIELKTCIEAIIQCSPELVSRIGQDYTVYAYDFSEYDNPLVGQGMLSKVLRTVSPMPEVPAQQSRQLITGRVCKNILGIFANGVKETLEVKLRLVPVPTVLQNEYQSTMEKYREINKVIPPPGFDSSEWTSFIQSNPNFSQMSNKSYVSPIVNNQQRDGQSLELVNQLLSPSTEPQSNMDSFSQIPRPDSDGSTGAKHAKSKKTSSRPSSRASAKRPRKPKTATAAGGNTSGYEEGTDGDDGPAPKKRAKITKADANQRSSFGQTYESLRVAASTASSLRLFRPIAMSPAPSAGSHLQEVPRIPTPVPVLPNRQTPRTLLPQPNAPRRDSLATQEESLPRMSPNGADLIRPEDELRYSIESANPSPDRNATPGDTPPDIASSPPVMRTQPPSRIPSSPPCPSSPVLPQMPRIDSGFMSGSLEDLFGDCDDPVQAVELDDAEVVAPRKKRRAPRRVPARAEPIPGSFTIECPGPVELLPTRMPIIEAPRVSKTAAARAARSRGGSMMSEDSQSLPPLNKEFRPPSALYQPQEPEPFFSLAATTPDHIPGSQVPQDAQSAGGVAGPQQSSTSDAQPSVPRSRVMVRTASMGSLTLPEVLASDPALPPSSLQRSQTWSEAPPPPLLEAMIPQIHPLSHVMQMQAPPMANNNGLNIVYNRTFNAKKAAIRNKLETAIMNGEMPPYCNNCGAIETPTWRKAWFQEHQGAPGYYDYSDEPGRVTAIVILTRDSEGNPTSYQLIKKYLLPEEKLEDFKELLLCNPCGIWMSKYKSQRPSDRWENHGPLERRGLPEKKRPQQRVAKPKKPQTANNAVATSEANYPPSEANFPLSEANFVQSELNFPQSDAFFAQHGTECKFTIGISPADTTDMPNQDRAQQTDRRRSTSAGPTKHLNAMTSDSASAALRRAIQSSPARWQGTHHSPIDVEDDMGTTRRLLFPSPCKAVSPRVLTESIANVIHIATDFHSSKQHRPETPNKENCPPAIDSTDGDADLLKLFEDELARPTTPTHNAPPSNPFKTPTRPTPSHRPITRSVSKSAGKTAGQIPRLTPSRTPCSAVRRSPRNHKGLFESPFTSTLNLLMSEANNRSNSPSRHQNDVHFDFENLPDLPVGGQHSEIDQNFNFDDFFSTDVPMPSSPPRMFQLYEDPTAMNTINWSDFSAFDQNMGNEEENQEVAVKAESRESPKKASEGDEAGRNSPTKHG